MEEKSCIPLSEAARILGIEQAALKKRCQRGRVPGAYKILDGKLEKWFIPAETLRGIQGNLDEDEYALLHAEWIRRMETGLGYKKPVTPRGVESHVYGLEKFWLFVENPPKVIKIGYKKGEERPKPTRKANLADMTLENLQIAISNVPIDRVAGKCHFSMRKKIYDGFRSFFKFLIAKGMRTKTDFALLDEARPQRIYEEKRPYLMEDGLVKLLEANQNLLTGRLKEWADHDACLTKLLIYLSALVGLRNEEMQDLHLAHISLNRQELSVIDGKGNKNRTVGFNEDVRDLIYTWVNLYRQKTKQPNLLVSRNGKPMSASMIYKRIQRVAKNAGLSNISPHALRRTCASIALESGVPLHHISENFGHTRTSTTEKSYVKVSQRQAVNAFKEFRPALNPAKSKAPSPSRKMKQLSAFSALEQF